MHARLSLLMFLQYAPLGALLPLFTLRLEQLGFTPLEMGWCCATQSLAALVTPLAAGQVADRWWSADRCVSVCSLLASVFLWLVAELTTPLAVFAAALAFWIVMSPAVTLGTTLCFAHLPPPGSAYGRVRLWGTIGWVATGWLIGIWLHDPDWLQAPRAWLRPQTNSTELADAFRIGSLACVALFLYSWTLPHTPPQRTRIGLLAPLSALKRLRGRAFFVYWICVGGVCVTVPFTTQGTPLLLHHLGIPDHWVSPTMTIGQSTEVISLALLPMLLTRMGIRGTMRLGVAAWFLYLAALTLGRPTPIVIASIALNGLCICCFLVAGQVFLNSRARSDIRASAQSLYTLMSGVGMLAGNLLFGWVREAAEERFQPTFLVGTLITGFTLIVFVVGFPSDDEAIEPEKKGGPKTGS